VLTNARGHWVIQNQLDLHGLVATRHASAGEFLPRRAVWPALRGAIITAKAGLGQQRAVLKTESPHWLAQKVKSSPSASASGRRRLGRTGRTAAIDTPSNAG